MKQQTVEENVFSLQHLKKKLPFSSGNYPYVCARVRARRALLLKQETYAKLLMMDVHEITRFLGESEYKDEIAELGLTYAGFELTEQALNRDLDEVYHQILGFCDGDLYTMLAAYMQREDIWNIKTILRGKYYNAKTEDIMRTIRAAGRYPEEYWRNLIQKSKTVEETIENLKGNVYFDTVHALKEEWKQHPDECENTLQKVYYHQLLDVVQSHAQPMMLFRDYIRREID